MFTSSALSFFAPQSPIGWTVRLSVLFVIAVTFAALPTMLGFEVNFTQHYILSALIVGMPFGFCLLAVLGRWKKDAIRIEALTRVDGVTGLPNHAAFIAQASRSLPQSGVLMHVDIDGFRGVNDRRGRASGDRCLMALAMRFRELTRQSDVLGRLDSAAFAIYLPGAPVERAREIADRLCAGVQVVNETGMVSVTLSVGAVLANGHTPLPQLMRDADRALDEAKCEGRAKVIVNELTLVA